MRKFCTADFAFYSEIFSALSLKEIKVLSLYCSGWHRNKIALALNISISTVKSHLSNAMQKLDVDSNAELKPLFYFLVNRHRSRSCCCHCCCSRLL